MGTSDVDDGTKPRLMQFFLDSLSRPSRPHLYAYMDDGGILCRKCCKAEKELILESYEKDGWRIRGVTANFEDPDMKCDHCGDYIPATYG